MRSDWLCDPSMQLILAAMMPENRLALEVSDATGLRIDDVLKLQTETIRKTDRPTVQDSKTGKRHRIYLPVKLRKRMLAQAGEVYVWPGRCEPLTKHRTRQAVWKDMVQAVAVFKRCGRVPKDSSISPHTMRKRAAVRAYEKGGLAAAAAQQQRRSGDHDLCAC